MPVAYFPPRQQRESVLHALEYLWSYDPATAQTTTRLLPVLPYLPEHRPLLVCVLSDFCAPDWCEALDIIRATHETLAVLIADEAECTLPAVGGLMVRDLESGQLMECDTASTTYRQAFREQMAEARARREQILRRTCGTQYVVATATTDYRSDLLRLFLARTLDITAMRVFSEIGSRCLRWLWHGGCVSALAATAWAHHLRRLLLPMSSSILAGSFHSSMCENQSHIACTSSATPRC